MTDRSQRIVILGAGPAGFATARAYREHGGGGQVTLVGAEDLLPYERPPLTKGVLRGTSEPVEQLLESPAWFEEHQVQLRLGRRAIAIDPRAGMVELAGGETLEAQQIVLATGGEPVRPDLPGAVHPRVRTIRTLSDSRAILELIDDGDPVVVVGTGFIGCEVAGSLALRGMEVSLVGQERLPQVQRLGEPAAERLAGWLEELSVRLVWEATVQEIHDGRRVELQGGESLEGMCVVLAMGVRPRGELAEAAGLPVCEGAVAVDEGMRCEEAENVLAVGDVACARHARAGRRLRVEHWGDALAHGEIAGRSLAGAEDARWMQVPGFWSTIGERTLKYAAWGDGYDDCRLSEHCGGAFTVWYAREGRAVGVLSHERDEDYAHGRELIAAGAPVP